MYVGLEETARYSRIISEKRKRNHLINVKGSKS